MNSTVVVLLSEILKFDRYLHVLSLFALLIIFGIYLWFVLVAGPDFMKKREACDITNLVRAYNLVQVVICTFYVAQAYGLGFTFKFIFHCERFNFLSDEVKLVIQLGAWMFLALRVFEFVETIFFVLRKKQNQASFLHIFHHIGSVIMTWLFIASHAELMAVYIAMINSTIHVIMYSYYFASSFKSDKVQSVIRRVKPLITLLQLTQFVIIIAHCIVAVLPSCNASYFFHLQILNFVVLFYLFGKFFLRTYLKSTKNRKIIV